jgi:two-component system KDP operon response regulator KdpE
MNAPTGKRILAVDDETRMLDFIRVTLEAAGHEVIEAMDGIEALQQLREGLPDLVLLDVGLPEVDGFETLKTIREMSRVPVIMLTVRADERDKIRGLELGADDYVTKPFSPGELAARIQAVLRRADSAPATSHGLLVVDDYLAIDFSEREVIVGGQRVPLRPTEYRLLYHLVQNAGRTLSYETLLARVWGHEYRDEIHYVHLYVTYLRQKIEPDPQNPRYILTKRGVGYSFRSPVGNPVPGKGSG